MHNHLATAKTLKNDEFYTRYEDKASEVQRYDLRGMSVYCNCDDAESAFIKYFIENFHKHGLKKLYASGIRGEYVEYDGKHILRKRINGDKDCKYDFYRYGCKSEKTIKRYLVGYVQQAKEKGLQWLYPFFFRNDGMYQIISTPDGYNKGDVVASGYIQELINK